jgi:RHS repeat-associated protein
VRWGNRDWSGEPSSGRSLDNMRRDYDPATGRYLEADPAGLGGGFALYPYARGNPIHFLDRTGAAPEDGSGVGNPFWFGWGLPTPEEHFRRNRNNRCPARPPENCEGWSKDPTWYAPRKFRHPDGYECAYDDFGNLLPDATFDSGTQNYSFNYAAGGGSFLGEFFSPRHFWQDIFPHFFYGGQYPPGLTQPLKGCGCEN